MESLLRARTVRRGRGKFRQVLVKWVGWIEPSWEPVDYIRETAALDKFEEKYGPIDTNDGPPETSAGLFVGQPEPHIAKLRQKRRKRRKA